MKLLGTIEFDEDLVNKKYVDEAISANAGVFVAVYEQTSYADVKAAIDAHKAIVLDMPANNNQFCMTFSTYTNGGNALMYAIYKMSDKPTLMTVTLTPQNQWTISHTDLQDKLVSGTNIKTINNTSLLGSGNIDIQGGGGDVFIAERNVTSYADVVQAINDGKVVVVKLYNDGSILFPMKQYANAQGVSFGGIVDVGAGESYGNVGVKSDDTWTDFVGDNIYVTYSDLSSRGYAEKTYVDTADTNLQTQIGTLTDLTTTAKTNLVGAINEVNAKGGGIDFEVGVEKPYGTYKDGSTTYQVYSKVVYIPALPSASGITNYPHGVTNIKQVLSMYGICTNGMVMNTPRQNNQDNIGIYQVQKSGGNFAIEVGKDRSSIGAYVTMIYAKNN